MAPPSEGKDVKPTVENFIPFLEDAKISDEDKVKFLQNLTEKLETVPPDYLKQAIAVFIKILECKPIHFISDYPSHQIRKLVLEVIQRLRQDNFSDILLCYAPEMMNLMYSLVQKENEENALICCKIIIEIYKVYDPQYTREISELLTLIQNIYENLKHNLDDIFKPKNTPVLPDLEVKSLLSTVNTIYTITPVKIRSHEKQYNLIPKASTSFKVLNELPNIMLLMIERFEQIAESFTRFTPLLMTIISLEPSVEVRQSHGFNRELFVDYMEAQISVLSLVCHLFHPDPRDHMQSVWGDTTGFTVKYEMNDLDSLLLVKRTISLLEMSPPEVTQLRKNLLYAIKSILFSCPKCFFEDSVFNKLLDEHVLIGRGCTAYEVVRLSAFTMLANLMKKIYTTDPQIMHLTLDHLTKAMKFFSRIIHDDTLTTTLQILCCQLLISFVGSLELMADEEDGNKLLFQRKELLIQIFEIFVLKLKTFIQVQLPCLAAKEMEHIKRPVNSNISDEISTNIKRSEYLNSTVSSHKQDQKLKFGSLTLETANYTTTDCHNLFNILISGAMAVTSSTIWKTYFSENMHISDFSENELYILNRLIKYFFDAYGMTVDSKRKPSSPVMVTRSQEDRDYFIRFSEIYTHLPVGVFREILSSNFLNIVNKIHQNRALLIILKTFLSTVSTTRACGEVLLKYLFENFRLLEGEDSFSKLHMDLFKIAFSSVTAHKKQNEEMFLPYIRKVFSQSLQFAQSAQKPDNYFCLLVSFYDIICTEFLALIFMEIGTMVPTIIEDISRLLSFHPKTHFVDVFVQLTLNMPLKLSSLLVYVPLLMIPLQYAIHGSSTAIAQGLLALKIFGENFQPYCPGCLEPMWAEVMQAVWKFVRSDDEDISKAAFNVLAVFGGFNRKDMMVPQMIPYTYSSENLAVKVFFHTNSNASIELPIAKIVESAYSYITSDNTEAFYVQQCWKILKGFLAATTEHNKDITDYTLKVLYSKDSFSRSSRPLIIPFYKCQDEGSRRIVQMALAGMFVSASKKEIRKEVVPFMVGVIYHYTTLIAGQHVQSNGIDPLVLIDALADAMQLGDHEVYNVGKFALMLIVDTATIFLTIEGQGYSLPLFDYLVEKMGSLCYERAGYKKYGGCVIMEFLCFHTHMHKSWIHSQIPGFVKTLFSVMLDLRGDVSQTTIDFAKKILKQIVIEYRDDDYISQEIIKDMIPLIPSMDPVVREQVAYSLELLAGDVETIASVLEPYKKLVRDTVLPDDFRLFLNSPDYQIAFFEVICFLMKEGLIKIVDDNNCHKNLLNDAKMLCDKTDEEIREEQPCYIATSNYVALKVAAMKFLSSCFYLRSQKVNIFMILGIALGSSEKEMKDAAYELLQQLICSDHYDSNTMNTAYLPVLLKNFHFESKDPSVILHLHRIIKLFRYSIDKDKLIDYQDHFISTFDNIQLDNKNSIEMCTTLINLFRDVPHLDVQNILGRLILFESKYLENRASPLRDCIVHFLSAYPEETLDFILKTPINYRQKRRFLKNLLQDASVGQIFETSPKQKVNIMIEMLKQSYSISFPIDVESQGIQNYTTVLYIIHVLVKKDPIWLLSTPELVQCLKQMWLALPIEDIHQELDIIKFVHWKMPKLIAKCLVGYFCCQINDFDLLFQLLRIFDICRQMPDFKFFQNFFDNELVNYPIAWKRAAFFKFVDIYPDKNYSQELKAKILQWVIIPCFTKAFECSLDKELIDGELIYDHTAKPRNIITVFTNEIIDTRKYGASLDSLRIFLLQLACLIIDKAYIHIHPRGSATHDKLRQMMNFAWPCLLPKNCVDPLHKYHGHLLLANIIVKFAIIKKIVLQVFHSLLKAHVSEARFVVQQSLDILTPAMLPRMADENRYLSHWTKKILTEEGHKPSQLIHLLQLLVRHYKVYKPVRHDLIPQVVKSINKLANLSKGQLDYKKSVIDTAEVIIEWEMERNRETQRKLSFDKASDVKKEFSPEYSVPVMQDFQDLKGSKTGSLFDSGGESSGKNGDAPLTQKHANDTIDVLLYLATQMIDDPSGPTGATDESLSLKCVELIKRALEDLWPNATLDFSRILKLLEHFTAAMSTSEFSPNNVNCGHICKSLELLTLFVTINKNNNEIVLRTLTDFLPSLSMCLRCQNIKVIDAIVNLLSAMMLFFPTEDINPSTQVPNCELDVLYTDAMEFVRTQLQSFVQYDEYASEDTSVSGSLSSFYGALKVLKAINVHKPAFIDSLLPEYLLCLQKLQVNISDSMNSNTDKATIYLDLLLISLDLIANKVSILEKEIRDRFFHTIVIGLLDRCTEKVMDAILTMIELWIKNELVKAEMSDMTEDIITLIMKSMECLEKSFQDETELNNKFFDIICYIYSEKRNQYSELKSKLECIFTSGLYYTHPEIRTKFFNLLHEGLGRRFIERLMFITKLPNKTEAEKHFWITQCLELMLVLCSPHETIHCTKPDMFLPSLYSVVHTNAAEQSSSVPHVKIDITDCEAEEDEFWEKLCTKFSLLKYDQNPLVIDRYWKNQWRSRISNLASFFSKTQDEKTQDFAQAACHLCHVDRTLSSDMWRQVFPKIWTVLSQLEQKTITDEVSSFLCGGISLEKSNYMPATILAESLLLCVPLPKIKIEVLKYFGQTFNLWHKVCCLIDQIMSNPSTVYGLADMPKNQVSAEVFIPNIQLDARNTLIELYAELKEDDMWAYLWQKESKYPELASAITLEQHGCFIEAQNEYFDLLGKFELQMETAPTAELQNTEKTCYEHWVHCTKQLLDWGAVFEVAALKKDPFEVLDNAMKISNWDAGKAMLHHIEQNYGEQHSWKFNLYKGYYKILHPDERNLLDVESEMIAASEKCLEEWKRLPHIVSHIHVPVLQAVHQILEIREALKIHEYFNDQRLDYANAVIRKWLFRRPCFTDDVSHWADVYAWRQANYHIALDICPPDMGTKEECLNTLKDTVQQLYFLSFVQIGKVARKQGLPEVALNLLKDINWEICSEKPTFANKFHHARQVLKTYSYISQNTESKEIKNDCLENGLELIENFNKDDCEEKYLSQLSAYHIAFLGNVIDDESTAISAYDMVRELDEEDAVKCYQLYGEFCEKLFLCNPNKYQEYGRECITHYLSGCDTQKERKTVKYIARTLWLLMYDDDGTTLWEAFNEQCLHMPSRVWLPWIPQLLSYVRHKNGKFVKNLLMHISVTHTQMVFFPVYNLYQSLALENRVEDCEEVDEILNFIKIHRPAAYSVLRNFSHEFMWFRDSPFEETLRHLRKVLNECYSMTSKKPNNASEIMVPPSTIEFLSKLASSFRNGGETYYRQPSSLTQERKKALKLDPSFGPIAKKFTSDFKFANNDAKKLPVLVNKLREWIKIFETKIKMGSRSFVLEDNCHNMAYFSPEMAELEIPSQYRFLQPYTHIVKMVRFVRRVEIIKKYGCHARRLTVLGHNGKLYSYLVLCKSPNPDSRRERNVFQMLHFINNILTHHKQTMQRSACFTLPYVENLNPYMILMDDNQPSLSLLDLFFQQHVKGNEEDDAAMYYFHKRLTAMKVKHITPSVSLFRSIFEEIQLKLVPSTVLKDWAGSTYPNAADYWYIRKQITVQQALLIFCEYVFHLSRLDPDLMYLHKDTGLVHASHFVFDFDERTGQLNDSVPIVPFRLTPNISEFITKSGMYSLMSASITAAARALILPTNALDDILKIILKDEITDWHKRVFLKEPRNSGVPYESIDEKQIIPYVDKALNSILVRLKCLATLNDGESKFGLLANAATSVDNLSLMDPTWYPWL